MCEVVGEKMNFLLYLPRAKNEWKNFGFDEFKAGTTMSFVAIFRNAAGKDCFKLEIPRAKLSEQPKFSDSDGIFVIERTFLAIADKGDDNFKLTYIKANNRNKQQAEGREQSQEESRREPSSS